MTVLFWSIILIGLAFVLHLIVWRIRIPKRQTKALLKLFFGVLVAGILLFSVYPCSLFGIKTPSSWLSYLHISLFFTSFTLAYMITYSALEVDSPSLVMIMSIADAGSDGMTKEDFFMAMSDDLLLKPRIKDLLMDKMAYLEDSRYHLTPKGQLMAKLFIFYRGLLKAGKGG